MARRAELRKANWNLYNFLENLLVFGMLPSRGVPAESGVEFYIGSEVCADGLCLVFAVDWGGKAPLISDTEIKPDYLVLFIPANGNREKDWLATIVEMKGADGKNLVHGVAQIQDFHQRMKRHVAEYLPSWLRIRWQGVLLHAPNADIPRVRLARTAGSDCPIIPVPGHHQVDLRICASQRLDALRPPALTSGKNQGAPACFSPLERAMALAKRSHKGRPTASGVKLDFGSTRGRLSLTLARDPALAALNWSTPSLGQEIQADLARLCVSAGDPPRWACAPEP